MRRLLCSLGILSLINAALPLGAQTPRPQFRPAVLATGPTSAINRIDVKALLSKGQKDGAVQFGVTVGPDGLAAEVWTYHAMPGSAALEQEVLKGLSNSKFTPPIYNHQPISALLSGTVVFDADVPPYLRIFLNQDPKEIRAGSDYIAPQPVIGANSGFVGLNTPGAIPVAIEGVVELEIEVDLKGNLKDMNVTGEDPPMLGFRDSAISDLKDAKFIPAFRNGDAIESRSVLALCYKPVGVAPEPEEAPSSLELQVTPTPAAK